MVGRYIPGARISFRATDYADHEGIITRIARDTVFMDYHIIGLKPTRTGGMWPDTLQTYHLAFNYHDILVINYTRTPLRSQVMGNFLQTAGVGMAAIGVINGFRNKEKGKNFFKGPYVISSPVMFFTGWLINRSASKKKFIGKKYSLQYIKLTPTHPPSS